MAIAKFLYPENIMLELDASDKEQVFTHIAALIEREHGVRRKSVFEGLLAREALESTALGEGVAIPHARVKDLRQPMAAFARLKSAIPFNAPDERPVSILLFLLAPPGATETHLQMLAETAEMLCDPGFRAQLRDAGDARSVLKAFQTFDAVH